MIDQKYLRQFPSCRDCGKPTLDKKRKLSTGYDWLRNFDGWLKSGKSYADFQKGEWLNAASQIHTHTA